MSPARWQQVSSLFDAVWDWEPARRAAYLDAACAGDDELRHEVETLLRAREQAGSFLQDNALADEAVCVATQAAPLAAGERVAHFEVLALVGAGAMGEVYRARDTRLEREVALKLLPPRYLADAGRVRRFAREARAASALNHPNIITVYDIGVDGTQHFIAAEYVVGQTLRERLLQGSLPWAEAVAIAQQIAAALQAAHAAGIVHRDIKPENVMLRADGAVKVLDFGIAKLLQAKPRDAAEPFKHSTEQGTVIGTPGYMSPEQARGHDVDARTDVFSLGVVLYEMLAGHAPFRGASQADVTVALLEREPEALSEVAPHIPVGLNEFMQRTLAKEADQRYASVSEWLVDLETIANGLLRTRQTRFKTLKKLARLRWLAGALMLIGLAAAGVLAWLIYRPTLAASGWSDSARLRVSTPYSTRMGLGGQLSPPSFAPDGRRIVFSLGAGGRSHIVTRELSSGDEAKLTNAEFRDYDPVWSPDGQHIAYISIRGGRDQVRMLTYPPTPSSTILDSLLKEFDPAMPPPFFRAWQRTAQGERIYFESGANLHTLDPATGRVEQLTRFDPQRTRAFSFSPAPAGDRIVYLEQQDGQFRLMLQALNGAPEMLWESADPLRTPRWLPTGEAIVFCANRNGGSQLLLLRLDTRAIEPITFANEDYSALAVAPSDQALLVVSGRENANLFAWDFQRGVEVEHTSEFGTQLRPEPAPNRQQLLFQTTSKRATNQLDIFSKPLASGSQPQLLVANAMHARWSPDGASVAFVRTAANAISLWRIGADGGTERQLAAALTPASYLPTPYLAHHAEFAWSPDGTRIAYSVRESGVSNLWLVARDGSGKFRLTSNAERGMTLYAPVWSPDGKRLAYLTSTKAANQTTYHLWVNEAGRDELVFQHSAPLQIIGWTAAGPGLLVATGTRPQWSAPQEMELLSFEPSRRKQTLLLKIADAYLPSLRLAYDGRRALMTTRQQGRDNLNVLALDERSIKRLTNNTDPTVFYTSPVWTADGSQVFYSKQTSWQFLHLVEKQ